MKDLLTGNLPVSFLLGGKEYKISSDFRTMLKLEEIFSSEELTEEERAAEALLLFYGMIPEPIEEAVEMLCFFWKGGRQEKSGRGTKQDSYQPPIYSFIHDAGLIYGAFLTQYGIDLTQAKLHWWQFLALFASLEEDRVLKEVMRCRAVEIKGDMPQAQKDYYAAMKRRYALPLPEKEERQLSALEAALLGDGDVDGVLAQLEGR